MKDNNKSNSEDIGDEWLKKFFLDPLTTLLDDIEFRIDLFETEDHYIVEALLPNTLIKDIQLHTQDTSLIIKVHSTDSSIEIDKERTICFPFIISNKRIHALFSNNILEVFINKKKENSSISSTIIMEET